MTHSMDINQQTVVIIAKQQKDMRNIILYSICVWGLLGVISCSEKSTKEPGTLFYEKGKILITCGKATSLEIKEICPDGSKKMNAAAFINGRFIEDGAKILFVEE